MYCNTIIERYSIECYLRNTFNVHCFVVQGMIALRRGASELCHEDYMDAILEVQAKKKANLNYYA